MLINTSLTCDWVSHLRLVGRDEKVNLKLGHLAAHVLVAKWSTAILAQDHFSIHPFVQIPHPNSHPHGL